MADNKVSISSVLKRNLKSGKEYNKLIPQVECSRTNLGSGDTFHTTDEMQKWIEKYAFQTNKLSPKLKGRGLAETVTNVYGFLYNHIQYEQDGALQQLRSPACTWKQRNSGVDCKSYSVFASSVLSNLGIKHFIRQIRQPNFYPEEFTHVYIVVPVDQSIVNYKENTPTYVLDATKHQNTEGNYIEKVDIPMVNLKHVGLNAPQSEGSLNLTKNFDEFSHHLIEKGIPVLTVNAMRSRVSEFTTMGKDPTFKIVDKGIIIQGQLFVLNFPEEEGYEEGLGFVVTGAAAMTAGKAIMKMLPKDFIGNTFGAVFANGFNLSCWGSAMSPSEAKKVIGTSIQPFFEYCFDKVQKGKEVEKYLNLAMEGAYKFNYIFPKISKISKYAKCSREGWAVIGEFSTMIVDHIKTLLDNLEKTYSFQRRNVSTPEEFTIPKNMTGDGNPYSIKGPNPVTYPVISNLRSKGIVAQVTNAAKNYQAQPNNNYQAQPANTNANLNDPNAKKSNTGLIIGGVALASLPFLFMMKSKSNK